jgi:hypothetical protein
MQAVAAEKAVDPLDLPPLDDAIDVDALDALFAPRTETGQVRAASHVEFSYADFSVRIDGEKIVLRRSDSPSDPVSYPLGDGFHAEIPGREAGN